MDERWRLIGHLGAQQTERSDGSDRYHSFDASLGVGAKFDRIDMQLLWVAISRANNVYPTTDPEDKSRWVLSASYAF